MRSTAVRPMPLHPSPLRPIVTAVRWASVVVGAALTGFGGPSAPRVVAGVVLATMALWWTVRPGWRPPGRLAPLWPVAEAVLAVAVVLATGGWHSPYVLSLATPVVIAGVEAGFVAALAMAAAVVAAVAVPVAIDRDDDAGRDTTLWACELVLVALAAGYARHLSTEAERRASQALRTTESLTEANRLLTELHRLTQHLPASLDLDETVASTVATVEELLHADTVVLALFDATTSSWTVARAVGVQLPEVLAGHDLPPPLDVAARAVEAQATAGGHAVVTQLLARDRLVGLVAAGRDTEPFDGGDVDLLARLVPSAALALDNARWFRRLRVAGAEDERRRIARDLHDSVAQSVAHVAFELDRLATRREDDDEVARIRDDVRRIVSQVRETLYDLRTEVTEEEGLDVALDDLADRVRARSGLDVRLRCRVGERPPLPQERELWRIAQEAVANVERHAQATCVEICWSSDGRHAELDVVDDGHGVDGRATPRGDAYGLVGMRERADAIGATLVVGPADGSGTAVRCRLSW